MKTKIGDPVFGELHYDTLWEKPYSFQLNGKKQNITIKIEAGEDAYFFDYQRRAYQWFITNPEAIVNDSIKAIEVYVRKNKDMFHLLEDENLTLELTEVMVLDSAFDNYEALAVLFESNADPEHGLGVQFANKKINAVGAQSEAFEYNPQRMDLIPPKMLEQSIKMFKHTTAYLQKYLKSEEDIEMIKVIKIASHGTFVVEVYNRGERGFEYNPLDPENRWEAQLIWHGKDEFEIIVGQYKLLAKRVGDHFEGVETSDDGSETKFTLFVFVTFGDDGLTKAI
jgi:hypothetical protein